MTGVERIAAERLRQTSVEGWSAPHDDTHSKGEMARAAACYVMHDLPSGWRKPRWPRAWQGWWKPKSRIRNLARAGALIAAEIDRLQRAGEQP